MKQGTLLLRWYKKNKRALPWRSLPTPYKIWIAEVMLQQTTVQTVLPYYKKFLKAFPNLKTLANTPIRKVLPYWAGLGYYSRVRNLHESARLFMERTQGKIPRTHIELEQYPGFGSYTARAVSSQAYQEPVSLLDGNIIRVICRHQNWSHQWWKKDAQVLMLKQADKWRSGLPSGEINQALMELGAIVCTPQSPSCLICPIQKNCKAQKLNLIKKLPIKRKKKKREIWFWKPQLNIKNRKIFLTQAHACPFLKNQWLLPGVIQKMAKAPLTYDFRHSITHYDIYIRISPRRTKCDTKNGKWIPMKEVSQITPSSLLKKIFKLKNTAEI